MSSANFNAEKAVNAENAVKRRRRLLASSMFNFHLSLVAIVADRAFPAFSAPKKEQNHEYR